MQKLIAYYRVSTEAQDLGLEAQKASVESFAARRGDRIIKAYEEKLSGTDNDRPKIKEALAHAAWSGASLVVARMDRLTRKMWFYEEVKKTGVKIVAADNPDGSEMLLQMLMVIAENEAKDISIRTKAALKALKARGVKLGSQRPEGMTKAGVWKPAAKPLSTEAIAKGIKAAATVNREKARKAAAFIAPQVKKLREDGLTYEAIAARFNEDGETTRRGKRWSAMAVFRIVSHEAA